MLHALARHEHGCGHAPSIQPPVAATRSPPKSQQTLAFKHALNSRLKVQVFGNHDLIQAQRAAMLQRHVARFSSCSAVSPFRYSATEMVSVGW